MGSFVYIECNSKSFVVPFLSESIKDYYKDIKCIFIRKGLRYIFYLYFPFPVDEKIFKPLCYLCYSIDEAERFYRAFPLVDMYGDSKIFTNDSSFWDEYFSLSHFYNRGLLFEYLNF